MTDERIEKKKKAMTAKEWLSRGRRLSQEIKSLEAAKQSAFERVTGTTNASSAVSAGGTKDPHKFEAYAEYAALIDQRVAELIGIQAEIIATVEKVQDARYRELLTDRYVRDMTWEQIAVEMRYTYRGVLSLHGKALEAVKVFIVFHTPPVV